MHTEVGSIRLASLTSIEGIAQFLKSPDAGPADNVPRSCRMFLTSGFRSTISSMLGSSRAYSGFT